MKKRIKLNKKTLILSVAIVVLLVISVLFKQMQESKAVSAKAQSHRTATVERRDIISELSSSGTVAPKDTYSITSLVEGEVLVADFEEGDLVEKGQILYQIDVSSMESELKSANNSLERAQSSFQLAQEDYQEAAGKYSGNTYKSTEAGYIKTLYIKAGDKIDGNTKLADIYNDKVMKLRVPFLSADAAQIGVGNEGVVTLTDTLEQIPGVVTAVSNMEETLAGGRLVRYVTMQVENPGGLTTQHAATVTIGDFSSSTEGVFTPMVDTVMSADISSNAEVEALLAVEGDYIEKGTPLFRMSGNSAEKLIRSYQDTMDKAQENLEAIQNKLEGLQDNYENYTITAPISGRVITKSVKAGDKISKNSSSAPALAVIYDLSGATFKMSVDELDVRKVKVGQKVQVTADAIENAVYTGTVTNVSLESSNANGVTNYPVTVTLDEVGELLPGMNVDGRIILEEVKQVLAVPAEAFMRGNQVYVKDETVTEPQGAVPAGFRAVDVVPGLISEDYVEIISGLSEGDQVYVDPSSKEPPVQMPVQVMMPAGGGPSGGQP